ncbi:hypothetical protein CRE_05053 [Caenorhabditis remanei]|uniref:Uncharacterized protein n=1 Tax=Caenorhabditis remanei TaxID=31234 RepID=E3MZ88_CAERE|nr:hypothetical protein CRE_05053 [Caenorhabditis remanei]
MISFIIVLLLPSVVQSCLKVRTVEPPKCECLYDALDKNDFYDTIDSHPFYSNLTFYGSDKFAKPIVEADECYVSLYCEGDFSLVVLDTQKTTIFGAYPADGMCDPLVQKWLVDDETGFGYYDRLYGTCVDFNNGGHLPSTKNPKTCGCVYKSLDSDNVKEYASHFDIYPTLLSKYKLEPALLSGTTEDGCATHWHCSSNNLKKIVVEQSRAYETTGPEVVTCYYFEDKNSYEWSIIPGDNKDAMSTFIYVTCIDYAVPMPTLLPPSTPTCPCKANLLLDRSIIYPASLITNWNIQTKISEDRCKWNISCKDNDDVFFSIATWASVDVVKVCVFFFF